MLIQDALLAHSMCTRRSSYSCACVCVCVCVCVDGADGPTEQQVIEIEAQDMRGSEIYDAILGASYRLYSLRL